MGTNPGVGVGGGLKTEDEICNVKLRLSNDLTLLTKLDEHVNSSVVAFAISAVVILYRDGWRGELVGYTFVASLQQLLLLQVSR